MTEKTDLVVAAVRADLLRRSQLGIQKYGTTLERHDLSLRDWLQHAYHEALDMANYLKRSIMEFDEFDGCIPEPQPPKRPAGGENGYLVYERSQTGVVSFKCKEIASNGNGMARGVALKTIELAPGELSLPLGELERRYPLTVPVNAD